MSESLLLTTGTQPATNTKTSVSSTATTCVSQAGLIPPGTDESQHSFERTESEMSNLEFGDGDAVDLDEGNTTSSLFHSWPSLSCVVERYSHHVLSRRRRRVICLADSGVLDTYAFDPERGEARKISSRDVDLHDNGATATSMCLLPGSPDYVVASLERLLPLQTSMDAPLSDRPICGGAIGEGGNDDNHRDRPCGRTGRRKQESQVAREKADQVVAIGTSHGGVILVETVANGTVSRDKVHVGKDSFAYRQVALQLSDGWSHNFSSSLNTYFLCKLCILVQTTLEKASFQLKTVELMARFYCVPTLRSTLGFLLRHRVLVVLQTAGES